MNGFTIQCKLSFVLRMAVAIIVIAAFDKPLFAARQLPAKRFTKIVFGSPSTSIDDFEQFAVRAKQSDATHINITSEDLPKSFWQYDTPGDPYPAWVITNTGLLKICPPEDLKSYLPADYAQKVMTILESRCRILRRLGLKATFTTFEPQMLPEKVFTDHPLWRGPRVDHPMRSRVARFAPSIDSPEVLALYRESLAELIRRCPEIEMLSMRTNDSGTGLSWSGGLYSGRFGNTLYKHRTMEQRLNDFFTALQQGAHDAGGSLEIEMLGTRKPDPPQIARQLKKGMAIENHEGPNATSYKVDVGFLLDYQHFYYPVLGIPQPLEFLEQLEKADSSSAPRLVISVGDRINRDLYFRIYDRFWMSPPAGDAISRLEFLKEIAAQYVGDDNAQTQLSIWLALHDAKRFGQLLDTGGCIFYLGAVQQRWLTRPLVPFPSELTTEEREYFRRFQFQARTEAHADDLADLQANRLYTGWTGRTFVNMILGKVRANVSDARKLIAQNMKTLPGKRKRHYEALDIRLQVFLCLINNAINVTSYQAQLDRLKSLGIEPEYNPVAGTQSNWDRQLMLETVRREIDNTALLMKILKSTPYEVIDLAERKKQEDIRLLGPDLPEQLQKKINIMNSHWEDYKRVFTTPNK